MKKILGLLCALIAIYTCFWYYKGHQIKEKALSEIAQANQNAKNPFVFTYSKASLGGYPFGFSINFDNPQVRAKDPQNESLVPVRKLGDLALGTNLFGSKIWIVTQGESDINFNVMNQGTEMFQGNTTFKEAEFCLSFKDSWYFLSLPKKKLKELWKESWDLYIEAKDLKIEEFTTQQKLEFTQEKGAIYASHQAKDGSSDEKVSLNIELEGYKLLAKGDLYPEKKEDLLILMNLKSNFPSLLTGEKSNFKFNLDLATNDLKNLIKANAEKLKKIDHANINMQLAFDTTENRSLEAVYDLYFKRRSEKEFDFNFYQRSDYDGFKTFLDSMLREYSKDIALLIPMTEDGEQKRRLEMLSKVIDVLAQSTVVNKVGDRLFTEVQLSLDSTTDGDGTTLRIDLPTFHYSFSPYLLDMKLSGQLHPEFIGQGLSPLKDASAELQMENYKDLIEDFSILFWELNSVKENGGLASKLSRNDIQTISNNIITFLRSLSDTPSEDGENLHITVEASDLTNIKVGTLTPLEVALEYNKMVEKNRQFLPKTAEKDKE